MKRRSVLQRKVVIIALIVAVLVSLIVWFSVFGLTPYVPVVHVLERGEHSLVYDARVLSPEHIDAICIIFDEYGVRYTRTDKEVLISRRLLRNKDLLQNYTHKAEALIAKANNKSTAEGGKGLSPIK